MDRERIRSRVLRGIALNRVPGLHFPGNLLDVSFDEVGPRTSRMSLDPGPHCADRDGQMEIGAVSLLADFALASCIRANLRPETRLATVTLALQFTGAARTGRIEARGDFAGFFQHGAGRLGQASVSLSGTAGEIGFGTGSFMALAPPPNVELRPLPLRRRADAEPPLLTEKDLHKDERPILRRADAVLADGEQDFLRRFWGYLPQRTGDGASCSMPNGPHVGNRVGHVQGGISLGLAATTASCALPASWSLAGMTGWYISPGEGRAMRARSTVIHQGRLTAVVRTVVTGRNRRRVIEVTTTHLKNADR